MLKRLWICLILLTSILAGYKVAGPITTIVTIDNGYWGSWNNAFQGQNTTWLAIFEPRIRAGNFFLGLQAASTHIYNAQIPRRAQIISATQRVRAYQASSGAVNVPMNTPNRATEKGRPLIDPFNPYEGWRQTNQENIDMNVRNTINGSEIETSGGSNNVSWILRQITAPGATLPNRERMAQRVVPTTAFTLGNVVLFMRRANNPVGNITVRVHPMVANQDGTLIPDENTTLATSDPVAASSIATTPVSGVATTFTFSGADQIAMSIGVNYAFVIDCEYTANNFDWVLVRAQRQFFTTGLSYHYGEGLGMDWQNYPGSTDLFTMQLQSGLLATDIVWNLPQFLLNQFYTSPDIAPLIQAQVNQPWYTKDSGILIAQQPPGSGNNLRVWHSAAGGPASEPQLTVTWRPRRVGVS